MEIGVYLIRVTSIDPPSEPGVAFEAEIFLDLRWSDPRLGSEMALTMQRAGVLQDEEAEELLDRIWWPDIYVTNEIGVRQTEQLEVMTIAGFHGNVASQLPHLDYWTVMDWVLALSYLLASGALIENIWVNEWRKRHDVHHAHKVDRTARWAFPSVFLVGIVAIWMFVYR